MSRDRARARAAREAERAAAPPRPVRRPPAPPSRPSSLRSRRSRQRRFGAMPVRTRVLLAVGFLAVQLLLWQLVPGAGDRVALVLVGLLVLPLVVVLLLSPAARGRSS